MVRSVNVKKTKSFKENRPENYHVHDNELTPKTLSALPTNQLKVSFGVRAATLRTIEVFAKSSLWTSPDIGMITVRGK